ncbi:hypothetical protein O3M35_009495 [Rhynocoris fuscipes]|uniref:Fanconi anemia group D2 protein n=1 Tax=Rhynocoris fuscipes TaxID=488301 RepID=A0AAW1D4D8_9HEMI
MYKRRKKLVNPQASSTLLANFGSGSLSQANFSQSDVQSSQNPLSQKEMFSDAESISSINREISVSSSKSPIKSQSKTIEESTEISSTSSSLSLMSNKSQQLKEQNGKKMANWKSRNTLKNYDDFKEMLKANGLILSDNTPHNVLMKDQAVFVRDLTKQLKNGGQNIIKRFQKFLEEYLSDKEHLQIASAPTKTDVDSNIARGEFQECLVRLLLTINVLQTRMTEFLLERLTEFLMPKDEPLNHNEGVMWVRLLLPPMRYLPNPDKSDEFAKTLFDLIHGVRANMVQHELINCLPDIIGDDQRDTVAKELMELIKMNSDLAPSILTALGNLCLEGTALYEVKMTLVKKIRTEKLDNQPVFISFIFKPPIDGYIDEYLNGIRSEMIICHETGPAIIEYMRVRSLTSADVSNTLIKLFERLKDLVLENVKLADSWLRNITKVKNHTIHKPLDLVMSLLLHSTSMCPSKKKTVEAAVRSRIRHGFFKNKLIVDTVHALGSVLKQNFPDLLKFLSSLLKSSDLLVSNFASFFFAECFAKLENEYCRGLVIELINNVRIFWKNAKPVLNLLHDLTVSHTSKMAPFLSLIMRLLDIVSDLNVFEIRQLMDTICILAYGNPDNLTEEPNSLQNDIYMIVQKQLSCPDPLVFKSGVICSLMAIKHMVTLKEGEPNETPNTEELQPRLGESSTEGTSTELRPAVTLNSNSEKAYTLLELVLAATNSNSEAHELCYDQLSYIVMSCDNMDKIFMKKLSLEMQNSLQNHYIIAASEFTRSDDDELESFLQFLIDNELEDPIVMNITNAVIKESKHKNNSSGVRKLVALPGLLRVIRGLQLADLSEIDALLGCYIAFPQPSLFTKFSTLDQEVQILAMDCLFHTCNWLREVLNSFVYLIKDGSPEKVLMRLRLIVHIQNLIASCLPQAIGYIPPKCVDANKGAGFLRKKAAASGLSQRPRSRKKKKGSSNSSGSGETKDPRSSGGEDNEGQNGATQPDDSSSDDESAVAEVIIESSYFQQYLRELDFDVCLILTQPLILKPIPPKDGKFSAEFGPSELMLLLDDLNIKLKYCLKPKDQLSRMRQNKQIEFNNFINVSIDLVVKNTGKLVTHMTNHLHKIVEYCYNLLQENDGVYDAQGMFCAGTTEIKKCAALIFSILDSFFSWPELKSEGYLKFAIKAALKLGDETLDKSKMKTISLNYALQSAIKYLNTISKYMLDLTSAVNLVTLVKTLNSLQDEDSDKNEIDIGELCNQFLQRKWFDHKGTELKGNQLNKYQACLLEIYLLSGKDSLDNIRKIITSVSEEVESLSNSESSFSVLPHFNKSNLNVLIKTVTKCLYIVSKNNVDITDLKEQFTFWDCIVDCLKDLVHIVKVQDGRVNLRQLLKGCFPILRLFKTNGMASCSNMFKIDAILVTQTIKKLQVVTRYIQSVCNFSKVTKDRALLQLLPGIRGILESIVLSVKSMILQNKCTEAFFMGSMKNKDHHGEIIPSQDSLETNSIETASSIGDAAMDENEEVEEEDEENNADDNDSDSTINADRTSMSEAF